MIAAEIAAALVGHRAGGWWSCRCPAHDDRNPSLSLRDGERGIIVRCWAGCDPRDVLAALRRLGLLGGGDTIHAAPIAKRRDGDDDTATRIEAARRIWATAREAPGSPVVHYLAGRGSSTIAVPRSLRYAPSLRRPDGTYGPAMVARIDSIDGELIGISRPGSIEDRIADGSAGTGPC